MVDVLSLQLDFSLMVDVLSLQLDCSLMVDVFRLQLDCSLMFAVLSLQHHDISGRSPFSAVVSIVSSLAQLCAACNYAIVCNGVHLSQDCSLLSRLIGMTADCCMTSSPFRWSSTSFCSTGCSLRFYIFVQYWVLLKSLESSPL
jgi:hypothetical protein